MNFEELIAILSILALIVGFIFSLYRNRPKWYFVGLMFMLIINCIPHAKIILDRHLHKSPDKKIINSFPDDLDFFTHRIVRFDKGEYFEFNSEEIRTKINMSKIYHKGEKYYILLLSG